MRWNLWKRHLAWAACAAIGLTLIAAGSAQATLVDSFDTAFNPPQSFLQARPSGESTAVVNDSSGIIGGQREMNLSLGSASGRAVIVPGGDGLLQVQAKGGVQSSLGLTYDGSAGLELFDATGLGGIALSGGSFLLTAMGTDPITATFRVFTDADNYSVGTLTTTDTSVIETSALDDSDNLIEEVLPIAAAATGDFETSTLAFSDFTIGAGDGADFDNVGAIQVDLEVTGSAIVGYDQLETGGEDPGDDDDSDDDIPALPEPGSWALLSLGALGAIGFGWFHRRKPQVV